jgi:hypothetical protein
MSEAKPVIVFQFDKQNYEPSSIIELKARLDDIVNVQVQEIIRREILPPALFVVLILVPLYYFNKGFFTKLGEKIGEKLGEAIGEDVVKAYEFFKKKTIEVIQKTKSSQIPMVEFRFTVNHTEVSGFVKSSEERILSRAFDTVEELFRISLKYIEEKNLDLKTFVFNLNVEKMIWKPTYCITTKNELYRFGS